MDDYYIGRVLEDSLIDLLEELAGNYETYEQV